MQPANQAGVLGLAWSSYTKQLSVRPLRTKALTSAAIAGCSEMMAQHLVAGKHTSTRRVALMALYGLLWNGPSAHYWQKFMSWMFDHTAGRLTVLKKVLFDQTTYGPLCNIMFMGWATLVLERQSVKSFTNKVKCDYPLIQLSGWRVWPLAALINYAFVPMQLRVLFINCVALCWSTYLISTIRRRSMQKAQELQAQLQAQHLAQMQELLHQTQQETVAQQETAVADIEVLSPMQKQDSASPCKKVIASDDESSVHGGRVRAEYLRSHREKGIRPPVTPAHSEIWNIDA